MNCWFLCSFSLVILCGGEWAELSTGTNNVNKSPLDAGNRQGDTPLHLSIQRGYNNLTRLLVLGGANLSAQNENGYTPLHNAVVYKNIYAVKLLLDKNVSVNVENVHHETPLYLAALSDGFKIAKLLVEHGAQIHTEERSPLETTISYDHPNILQLFLDKGLSVNGKIFNSYLLEYAIKKGSSNVAKLLLDEGANCTVTNAEGESLLYAAMYTGNIEIAELIINSTSSNSEDKYPKVN